MNRFEKITASIILSRGGFITDWEYNSTQEKNGKTYHVWECKHQEGYTAYALTHQPARGGFVKPIGTGHYVGELGLKRKTGIDVTPNG